MKEIERLLADQSRMQNEVAMLCKENANLQAALERIAGMSERPVCVCGVKTGTAAIKACTLAALKDADSGSQESDMNYCSECGADQGASDSRQEAYECPRCHRVRLRNGLHKCSSYPYTDEKGQE